MSRLLLRIEEARIAGKEETPYGPLQDLNDLFTLDKDGNSDIFVDRGKSLHQFNDSRSYM